MISPDDEVSLEALQAHAILELQSLVDCASEGVCPLAISVLRRPKECVKATKSGSAPDLFWHGPVAAWMHLQQLARRQEQSEDKYAPGVSLCPPPENTGTLRLVTASQYGTTRVRLLTEAASLADLLLEAIPSSALASLVSDIRVQPGGGVSFTTAAAFASRSATGLIMCGRCGSWYRGARGLRIHLEVAHVAGYEDSKREAEGSSRALAVRAAPEELVALAAKASEVAASDKASKHKLHPGLVAARDGDLTTVLALVDSGRLAPESCCDRHGSTALMYASGAGHVALCAYLIEACRVDARYAQPDGRTAFMWAARNGHLEVAKMLEKLAPGVAHAATRDGTTSLHWACWQGHIDMCEWLVDEAGCDLHALNSYGCNASQWAAQSGDIAMLEWLAGRGLDLRIINRNGHSVLHKAATSGQSEACEWLIARAKLDARHMAPDGDGNTPRALAAAGGWTELAALFEAHLERLKM